MKRLLLLLAIVVLPIISYAQQHSGIFVRVGENGKRHDILHHALNENQPLSTFKKDPVIYAASLADTYTVVSYEVSILAPDAGNDLIGPIKVSGENKAEIFKKHEKRLKTNTRVYFENIVLKCEDCATEKEVRCRSLSVLIE
ncbi:MAG: hypothetical protein H6551_05180 [Chitinophagales bacterium]|nr:hypothetical protein [Chitinophagaceae bacterium]MCB9064521.1 hypothetical protein [Chitinophagales bacterium]